MTEKLYDENSHLFEFTARVIACNKTENGYAVILDRTAFFPEGGGQPSDTGTLGAARVFDVQIRTVSAKPGGAEDARESSDIVHYTDQPLEVGSEATGRIDTARRTDFMQQHSAEHIVSGIVHSRLGYENVGFHLSRETVTLDFSGLLSDCQIADIEREANERVRQNVRFKVWYPSAEELETLSYRSKKELNAPIRMVEIENTDRCACCAPHVSSAAEIGVIHLEDLGKMRGGTRLSLKAGARAVSDYRRASEALGKIGALLSAKQGEEAAAVERLSAALEAEKMNAAALEKRLIKALAAAARREERALFCELSGDFVFHLADALHTRFKDLRAVFSPAENGFSFALRDDEADLAAFFESFRGEFPVRGGGKGGMRRGSVAANEDELKKFFQLR